MADTRATVIRTIGSDVKEAEHDIASVLDTLVQQLGNLGQSALEVLKAYMQLPLSAPTMAAVIGILTNDMLAHKVNFVKWEHQETVCVTCTAKKAGNTEQEIISWLANPVNAGASYILSTFEKANASHAGDTLQYAWVPGLITTAANLQIAGVILGSFGISAAGAIISDITSITKLVGQNNPAPLTTPSVQTLNLPISTVGQARTFKVS